ncbi:fetuin-B-like [Phyllobates terribilis]|uniref:fetuin-B-like n=1 Tax=Phyllobates terribilis TaxID=111132 RepID=UPI003CCA913C
MKVTTLLLISTQLFLSTAGRPRGNKEPEVTSIACNDPAAEAAADLSLRQLNANRREGAVLGLKRISNVQQQSDEENGSVFYLTIDVLETECHVLSRRLWKDCGAKPRHEAAFGQCRATFQLNKPERIAHLYNYDCRLSPAARQDFSCAGCYLSRPLNDSNIQEVAEKSLEKFNKESDYNKYFGLGNITKGARQVVAGTAFYVEFTIHESNCNKSDEDFSLCDPLECEFAHTGYCKSFAVTHWSNPTEKSVLNVTCEIFEPEAAIVEEQKHNEGHNTNQPINDKKDSGKQENRAKGQKPGQKEVLGSAKFGNKQGQKHDSGSDEHDHDHEHLHNYEHHHSQPQSPHGPPSSPPKTVGTITYLSGSQAPTTVSHADQEKKGKRPKPDKKGEEKPSKSFIRPFPEKASTSDQCPGPAQNIPIAENIPGIGGTQ